MQIHVKTQAYKVKLYINNIQRTQPNPLSLNSSEIWAHLLRSKVAPVQIVFENHRRVVHTKQANRAAGEDLKRRLSEYQLCDVSQQCGRHGGRVLRVIYPEDIIVSIKLYCLCLFDYRCEMIRAQ